MNKIKYKNNKIQALSLIELVLSMTIVAVILTSVVFVFYQITITSPPAISQQALNIASGYLSEILTKQFPTTLPCPAPPVGRVNYVNVCDYNNLSDVGAKDNQGNALAGLNRFNVTVTLDTVAANLGGLTATGNQVVRIDVRVTNPQQFNATLIMSAYKGNH